MVNDKIVEIDNTNPPQSVPCGIVMPISAIGDCNEAHWAEVFAIVSDAIEPAGFKAQMVSGADEVTVIQKTIVQNLYDNPVVIVDVSERNPNVMFELGMRLAFDKPTIIIKDDRTSYIFDTGVIEHLEYPRDLRFSKIVEFKKRLSEKLTATYKKQTEDPSYSTFLKHFGEFKLSSIEHKELGGQDFIIAKLEELEKTVNNFAAPLAPSRRPLSYPAGNEIDICCAPLTDDQITRLNEQMIKDKRIQSVRVMDNKGHIHLYAAADFSSINERRLLESEFQNLAKRIKKSPRLISAEN